MKDVVLKFLLSVAVFAFCGIPTWIWLGARSVIAPQGFWQEFAVGVVGLWVLGAAQVGLGLLGIAFMFVLWFDNH